MSRPYEWSHKMQGIVRDRVDNVVRNHPATEMEKQLYMGFPMEVISRQILAKGLADFNVGYKHPTGQTLSPEELVSLYCYANMKNHFFTCYATFEEHREVIEDLYKPHSRILVIDFGCGPATACLALADLLPNRMMDYIGIDTAPAMRTRGFALWDAANVDSLLIQEGSTMDFKQRWNEISIDGIREEFSVMLVFSYFFASKSLSTQDVDGLAAWISRLGSTRTGKPLALFYMNSTDGRANEKYHLLKRRLGIHKSQQALQTRQIEYRTWRGGSFLKNTEFMSELLTLNSGQGSSTVAEDDLIPF